MPNSSSTKVLRRRKLRLKRASGVSSRNDGRSTRRHRGNPAESLTWSLVGRDALLLLVRECYHRINQASSSCRNPARQRRDTQQNRRYTDENRNVNHALGNSVDGNRQRKYPSNRRAPGDCTQVLANN